MQLGGGPRHGCREPPSPRFAAATFTAVSCTVFATVCGTASAAPSSPASTPPRFDGVFVTRFDGVFARTPRRGLPPGRTDVSYGAVVSAAGAGAYPVGRAVKVPRPWVRLRSRVA
ncbi:hypothetical protein GCM10010350_06970 [Streptomyces galilaeus]|nr:hypothetical protein GCM10010350_06970 [Streptomyces galilaeus]